MQGIRGGNPLSLDSQVHHHELDVISGIPLLEDQVVEYSYRLYIIRARFYEIEEDLLLSLYRLFGICAVSVITIRAQPYYVIRGNRLSRVQAVFVFAFISPHSASIDIEKGLS